MFLALSNQSDKPIYEQIATQIKQQIASGKLAPHEALPSIRALARDMRISVITTKRAYEELEAEGLLERCTKDGNRYRALLRLTQQGVAAAQQVKERAELAVEKAGSGMIDAQRVVFYEVLNLIAGHLQVICEEGLENV